MDKYLQYSDLPTFDSVKAASDAGFVRFFQFCKSGEILSGSGKAILFQRIQEGTWTKELTDWLPVSQLRGVNDKRNHDYVWVPKWLKNKFS